MRRATWRRSSRIWGSEERTSACRAARTGATWRGPLHVSAVDVSHFEREGIKWTREILEPAVAASTSVNEVLRRLGLEVVGGHHTHISRRIKSYGLDTTHFTPVARTERQRYNQRRRAPEEILVEDASAHARRVPSRRLKRAMGETGVRERCALCGIGPVWLGEPLPLEVDHIDGNWRDNRIQNLRLLCPNCHSTTDSYRGRGKGRARVFTS
ncbi:HNH endonuclease signature motif containing protein [Streptomyces sp. NPDC050523]|uniref:HNH endonuclease signature motif containing protein n=1 Tax=Streptomyces sp. NPDC050523 TaxID=3365622 RepID=UPI00378C7836